MSGRWAAICVACLCCWAGGRAASAADKFYVYNLTTSTDFKHVYLAPTGTQQWGSDETLNDDDKALNVTERILLTGIGHKVFDVKLVDAKGRTCIKHGVDLTHEKTFDVRDADLEACK